MIHFDFSVGAAVDVQAEEPYIEEGQPIFEFRIRTRVFEQPYVTFNGVAEQPIVRTVRPREAGEVGLEDYQIFESGELVINTWPDHRHFVYRLSIVRTETVIQIKDEDPSSHPVVPWTFNEVLDEGQNITTGLIYGIKPVEEPPAPSAWDRLDEEWIPGDAL